MFYAPYVSVAQKREVALQRIRKLKKQGLDVQPIDPFRGAIATTFWGKAWCNHLESFADYQNRLPRARTYIRNGFICDLQISQGNVRAMVSGSSLYTVTVELKTLEKDAWLKICQQCQGQVNSLLELLQGKFSKEVMSIVSNPETGIFPKRKEIKYKCSCPDWAVLCKHAAAVLYAVGRRLDTDPGLLFTLRGVDPADLFPASIDIATTAEDEGLELDDMGALFDIDLQTADIPDLNEAKEEPKTTKAKPVFDPEPLKNTPTTTAAKTTPSHTANVKAPLNPKRPTANGIKKLRQLANLTLTEFAAALNVSAPTVSRWEKTSGILCLRQDSFNAILTFQEKLLKNL